VGTLRRIAAAALVAAAAVAVVLLLGRDVPLHGVRPARALTVRTSFDPPAVQFGDRVVARVVVLADRGALDTSRLHVSEDVAPLTPLGPAHVTRTMRGRLLVVSYDLPTVCLSAGCVGRTTTKELRLPAARADAPRRGGGIAYAGAVWPALQVGGRVTAADLAPSRPPFRADTSVPAVSYRIAPGTLSLLLDIIAAVLAAAGAALAVWQAAVLLRRARSRDLRSPLERALALVREAESRPPDDRRRAVGFLARVLRRRDESLAQLAGDLAWSEPAPAPDELAAIADQVGREVGDA
jgi:hypothetical protein